MRINVNVFITFFIDREILKETKNVHFGEKRKMILSIFIIFKVILCKISRFLSKFAVKLVKKGTRQRAPLTAKETG